MLHQATAFLNQSARQRVPFWEATLTEEVKIWVTVPRKK